MSNCYNHYLNCVYEHVPSIMQLLAYPELFPHINTKKAINVYKKKYKITKDEITFFKEITIPTLAYAGIPLGQIDESFRSINNITNLEKMVEGRSVWIKTRDGLKLIKSKKHFKNAEYYKLLLEVYKRKKYPKLFKEGDIPCPQQKLTT